MPIRRAIPTTTRPPAWKSFNVTKEQQTISFTQPSDTSLTSGPVSLSASASSTLGVGFSSSTTAVCTFWNSVTLVSVGLCSIDADQAGNTN